MKEKLKRIEKIPDNIGMIKGFVIATFIVFHLLVHGLASAREGEGIVAPNRQITNPDAQSSQPGASVLNALVEEANTACREHLESGTNPTTENNPYEECINQFLTQNADRVREAQRAFSRTTERNQINNEKSETEKQLRNALDKKTRRLLRGSEELGSNEGSQVDHREFYRLYEAQLAKSVTLVGNSYCMFANQNNYTLIKPVENPSNRQTILDIRNANIQLATQAPQGNNKPPIAQHFERCVGKLKDFCDNQFTGNAADISDDDKEYTRQRACLTKTQLRKLARTISESQRRTALVRQNRFNGYMEGVDWVGIVTEFYDSQDRGRGYDAITSFSASEFSEDVLANVESNLEQCRNHRSINNLESDPNCDNLVNPSNTLSPDDYDEIIAQNMVQTRIAAQAIDDLDENGFLEALEVDGYTAAQLANIENGLSSKLEDMKNELKSKYEQEREQSLKYLLEKMERDNGGDTAEARTGRSIASTSSPDPEELVRREIASAEDMNALFLFNNFVTGYLDVCSGGRDGSGACQGATTYNLSAIEADINNLEGIGGDLATVIDQQFRDQADDVYRSLESQRAPAADESSPSGGASLGPEQINCSILKDFSDPNSPCGNSGTNSEGSN